MSEAIKKAFVVDGKIFDTQAEAADYMRRPKVIAALDQITKGNTELNDWLYNHQETLEQIFDCGTIKRVTKAEKKALDKALEAIVASGDKAFAFVIENSSAISESFRWPSVKRMDDAEKETVIKANLMSETEDDADLTQYIMDHKVEIFAAYKAGKVVREVSQKALDGLAAFREKKAREKAEKEAAAAPVE